MHFHDIEEALQFRLLAGATGFLELAELRGCSFELAGETLGVDAQVG